MVLAPEVSQLSLQSLDAQSDLIARITGQATSTASTAKIAAEAMAQKTAQDAKIMGDLTKKLSIERTMESRRNGGFLLMDLKKAQRTQRTKRTSGNKGTKGTASSGNERNLQDMHKNMGMQDMDRALAGMNTGGRQTK